jgi:predicted transposase/invertase (TIGR01784 family)
LLRSRGLWDNAPTGVQVVADLGRGGAVVIVGIDPKVDYAFKRLLGRPENISLLIHLLQAVLQLPAGHQIVSLDLLNPFNEKDFETDKLSILDIKVCDQAGRLYNVEMQLLVLGSFRARVLYYWAQLYADQLQEGIGYEALRPTVSIIFVNALLFPKSRPLALGLRVARARERDSL